MARIYGEIRSVSTMGSRKERTVSRTSRGPMTAHIRGWNRGVAIDVWIDSLGRENFTVYATQGSNGGERKEMFNLIDPASIGPRDRRGKLK